MAESSETVQTPSSARGDQAADGRTGAPASPPTRGGPRPGFRRASIAVFVVVVLLVAAGAAWLYFSTRGTETTDDAFIAATTYSIAPRVPGRIVEITVDDNARVEKGQVLARIDPAAYEAAVDHASAALDLAKAQLRAAQIQVGLIDAVTAAGVDTAGADVESAKAELQQAEAELDAVKAEQARASAELERYSKLSERAVTQQRLDEVRTASENADAQVRAAERKVASDQAGVAASESRLASARADRQRVDAARADAERRQAEVAQAEADLRRARLDLSYTTIVAPGDGRVTAKAVSRGDYVTTGQHVMALVAPDAWVVANFKETQLADMKIGQHANVHIDAYGVDLPAEIDSIQAGSGAQFSLLPPQNATGNYVKVVQRVPVKLTFQRPEDAAKYLLGPGMSVEPKVFTR